jgi:hypothetical protein
MMTAMTRREFVKIAGPEAIVAGMVAGGVAPLNANPLGCRSAARRGRTMPAGMVLTTATPSEETLQLSGNSDDARVERDVRTASRAR